MTLDEIKDAVSRGWTVHWKNDAYEVRRDSLGQWLIVHDNNTIGLTWSDGKTLNGDPEDFYIDGAQERLQSRIYRGELEVTEAEGVTTMRDLQ